MMECRDILQKGCPQALVYAAVVMMPQLNGHSALDLFTRNYVFKAGFWAWLLAQTLKVDSSVACKHQRTSISCATHENLRWQTLVRQQYLLESA